MTTASNTWAGKLLAWNNPAKSTDGVMSGTSEIFTDWFVVPNGTSKVEFESLFNGNPKGEFFVESSLVGPPKAVPVALYDNPDGSVYSGDLSVNVAYLDTEDVGSTPIVVYGGIPSRLRLRYVNESGSGTVNTRVRTDSQQL